MVAKRNNLKGKNAANRLVRKTRGKRRKLTARATADRREAKRIRFGPTTISWGRRITDAAPVTGTVREPAARNAAEEAPVKTPPFQDPGPIAIIDMGRLDKKHDVFAARKVQQPAGVKKPSQSSHATEVAAIIADNCDARIHLYNVWDEGGFRLSALLGALRAIAKSETCIVNLSIGSTTRDKSVEKLIEKCINAGKIVIAAAGELPRGPGRKTPLAPMFPASMKGVIAVGAVNPFRRDVADATAAKKIIKGPGESMRTIQLDGSPGKRDGSSYATAYASAVAWTILSKDSSLKGNAKALTPRLEKEIKFK